MHYLSSLPVTEVPSAGRAGSAPAWVSPHSLTPAFTLWVISALFFRSPILFHPRCPAMLLHAAGNGPLAGAVLHSVLWSSVSSPLGGRAVESLSPRRKGPRHGPIPAMGAGAMLAPTGGLGAFCVARDVMLCLFQREQKASWGFRKSPLPVIAEWRGFPWALAFLNT